MVKKYETNCTDVLKSINEINSSTSSEHLNGSYADSLKFDLKKKQQQSSTSEDSNDSTTLPDSTADFNGLLNELVVNVSNVQQPNQQKLFTNKQVNMPNQLVNQFDLPNNFKVDAKKSASSLISESSTSISSNNVSQTIQATISSLSTKKVVKKESTTNVDCQKKKIKTQLIDHDSKHETVEVLFFIKNIIKDTLNVDFKEKSLMFKFKTLDSNFMRIHFVNLEPFKATSYRITNGTINGTSTEEHQFNKLKPELDKRKLPIFTYSIDSLIDKIIPAECTYELTENHLKIKLRKKNPIKWDQLELIKPEMCVNYLKNVANVQLDDNSAFKYKPLVQVNKSSNVSKLANNYEKNLNNNNQEKDRMNDKNDKDSSIPIPPPLPSLSNNKSFNNYSKLNGDLKKKEEPADMLCSLIISPVKAEDKVDYVNKQKPEPFSFREDEDEQNARAQTSTTVQPTLSLKLNLADLRGKIGYTGLSNLGNTCYMNSCLQCLSNTVELRDYFLNEQYKEDLNRDNPFGSNGQLAEAFSEVLYKLWTGESSYFSPSRFKRLIDENCSQFIGYSQHDSVEFMEHFLDVLHEDINRVDRKKIPAALPIEDENLTDEELANEQWKRHKDRNDSIITKLFYGQYKSKLVCPKCSKISITFDPFLYLPIPLTKNKVVYNVYLFLMNTENPPDHMSIKLPQGSKISNLLEIVSSKTGINRFDLLACSINQSGELETEFRQSAFLPDYGSKTKKIYVYQKYEHKSIVKFVIHQTVPEINLTDRFSYVINNKSCEYCNRLLSKPGLELTRCTDCNKVTYCCLRCKTEDHVLHLSKCKNEPVLVGWPSIQFLNISTVTYEQFMNRLEQLALKSVEVIETEVQEQEDNNVHIGEEIQEGEEIQVDQLENKIECDANENQEKEQIEEENMEICFDETSQDTVAQEENESSIKDNLMRKLEEHKKEEEDNNNKVAEDNCFRFILRGKENDMMSSTKQLIYIPKDENDEDEQEKFRQSLRKYYYLYVDWKERFSKIDENGKRRTYELSVQSKNLNLISTGDTSCNLEQEKTECTLEGLMTKFTELETLSAQEAWVCPTCKEPRTASKELTIWRPPQILIIQLKRFSYSSYSREKIDKFVNYPIKGLDISKFCTDSKLLDETQPIYDLFAVIDHFGGLYGGHYTANANSSVNNKELGWRAFNDSSVRDIDEDSAVSRSAYVLFYRLRNRLV